MMGAEIGASSSATMIAWPVCSASAAPMPPAPPRLSAAASARVVAATDPLAISEICSAVIVSGAPATGDTVAETRPIATPSANAAATPNVPSALAGVGSATPAGLFRNPNSLAINVGAFALPIAAPAGPPVAVVVLTVRPSAISETSPLAWISPAVVACVLSSTMPKPTTAACAPEIAVAAVRTAEVCCASRVKFPSTTAIAPASRSAPALSWATVSASEAAVGVPPATPPSAMVSMVRLAVTVKLASEFAPGAAALVCNWAPACMPVSALKLTGAIATDAPTPESPVEPARKAMAPVVASPVCVTSAVRLPVSRSTFAPAARPPNALSDTALTANAPATPTSVVPAPDWATASNASGVRSWPTLISTSPLIDEVPSSVALVLSEIAFRATAAPTPGPPCTALAFAMVVIVRLALAAISRPWVVAILAAPTEDATVSSAVVPAIAAATVTPPSGVIACDASAPCPAAPLAVAPPAVAIARVETVVVEFAATTICWAKARTPVPNCTVLPVVTSESATVPPTALAPPALPSANVVTVVLSSLWTDRSPIAPITVVPVTSVVAVALTSASATAASAPTSPSGAAFAVTCPLTSTSVPTSTVPTVPPIRLAPSTTVCAVAFRSSVARVVWVTVPVVVATLSSATLPPTTSAPCTATPAVAAWLALPVAVASNAMLPAVKPLLALANSSAPVLTVMVSAFNETLPELPNDVAPSVSPVVWRVLT